MEHGSQNTTYRSWFSTLFWVPKMEPNIWLGRKCLYPLSHSTGSISLNFNCFVYQMKIEVHALFCFWDRVFLCVVLAVLELALLTRLASNSGSAFLCLQNAGIKSACHPMSWSMFLLWPCLRWCPWLVLPLMTHECPWSVLPPETMLMLVALTVPIGDIWVHHAINGHVWVCGPTAAKVCVNVCTGWFCAPT